MIQMRLLHVRGIRVTLMPHPREREAEMILMRHPLDRDDLVNLIDLTKNSNVILTRHLHERGLIIDLMHHHHGREDSRM